MIVTATIVILFYTRFITLNEGSTYTVNQSKISHTSHYMHIETLSLKIFKLGYIHII